MNLGNLNKVLAGQPSYRMKQVYDAVFREFVSDWEEAKSLPKDLRAELSRECPLDIEAEVFESGDGATVKAGLKMEDGAVIEAVLMKHKDRNTVCVSCQVGCAMNCAFCATGRLGFSRNLSAFEMVEQVLVFERILLGEGPGGGSAVTNVVFMGMGEPFNNYDSVMEAVRLINEEIGIGARSISISTCGVVAGIKRFADEGLQVKLAVSLHAPNDSIRGKIMPVNDAHSVDELLDALASYIEKTNKKVMIEYLLLKDVNDSDEMARELAAVLKAKLGSASGRGGGLFMINLIPFNPTQGFQASSGERISRFREILEEEGLTVTQRYRFGREIKGACGQLAGEGK
ncbi:23S rRNA (adenine(2503)-C(2))-methyltransferase RlmN [Candidatus Peregrinibacteria bacterium]|jgi:23S rRNA (adenine2503-C2)-methyltransferase|nr:23S rRNA (adenine(2503)-C(2))-methyltransferase RlmN [Candidatus Peregrinibacteria bacterium]MBT4147695.1 23S rRNA (adenine(2503)-C(2))-methyltransferase RlmN [Candidatus Peregrinibacteria bacterium]MBT4366302.1 23S rRNA (adenine(2503)-C(2))-methyltransferase RlmN [Candidatus Peregrinibacteria bacterium]MBT4455823.1 23S rRNA (adenine(2503)-C(2))-methyltransferase RlmN [Candidatus Peregrinibacteria bacterium]